MRVLAVLNHKGGVGKTTTAHNVAAGLARRGLRVVAVDLDPQGHLGAAMGHADPAGAGTALLSALSGGDPAVLADLLVSGPVGIDLLPSGPALGALDGQAVAGPDRERRLAMLLSGPSGYDLAVLDCPPNLGLLTINALAAATDLLIPTQAEFFALQSLAALLDVVAQARRGLNPELRVAGIVLTRFSPRKTLHREAGNRLRRHFPAELLDTRVRENVALAEAPGFGRDIFDYAPKSQGALDYANLCRELVARLGLAART